VRHNLTCLFLLGFLHGQAQVRFGNRAGLCVGWQDFERDADYIGGLVIYNDLNARPIGSSEAITLDIPISDHWSLGTEVGYSEKGFRTQDIQAAFSPFSLLDDQMDRIGYLDLWALAKYSPGYGGVRLEVLAGPVMARSLHLRQNPTVLYTMDGSSGRYVERGTLLAPWEFSACGGLGVVLQPGIAELHLGWRYIHGLSSVYGSSIAIADLNGYPLGRGNMFNRTHLITIGWSLPISRKAWEDARPASE
jgi:hypothetical protein